MYFGCAWYPEHWPRERWDMDLDLMRDAGMNVVRVGEFAWSRFEPSEGRFSFEWMDHAIERAAERGIKVVIGTPTAAPPAWLTQKYPEVLRTLPDGRVTGHGARQHFNPASSAYLALCRRIAGALGEHYGANTNVIGWQIDNEMADISFDPGTRRQFQEFCRQRYGNLDALNRHWTTAYFSQEYSSWDQIPLAVDGQNACLVATLRQFVARVWKDYFDNQADAIRAHGRVPQFVTHNFSYTFSKQDPHELAKNMEFGSVDAYPFGSHLDPAKMGFFLAATRGLKRGPFWVMETQPGFVNYMPVNLAMDPGETRRMVWHQAGHGAEAVLFWQWRSALGGQEQWHGTLIGADGRPRPLLKEVSQIGYELGTASAALAGTAVKPRVALVWSYRDRAAIETCRFHRDYDPWHMWRDTYGALRRCGLDVDVVRADQGLEGYAVVFAPQMTILDAELEQSLVDYVEQGGHLVMGPRAGFLDTHGALLQSRPPGARLAALLGGHSEEHYSLGDAVQVTGPSGMGGAASVWGEWLERDAPDVEVVLRYGRGHAWLERKAALLTRSARKGRISYLGAWLDRTGMLSVAEWACRAAGVAMPWGRLPEGIEVSCREGAGRRVHVICNHAATAYSIDLPFKGVCAISGTPQEGTISLAGNEVVAIVEQRQGSDASRTDV
jgi:beta-galactosidase